MVFNIESVFCWFLEYLFRFCFFVCNGCFLKNSVVVGSIRLFGNNEWGVLGLIVGIKWLNCVVLYSYLGLMIDKE